MPVLHLATFGHQPQDAAAVQSEQDEYAAQLILMVLRRVLAVMYRRDPVDEVIITLHPNDNVAVPPLALNNVMLTA